MNDTDLLRAGAFAGLLLLMLAWERWRPRRAPEPGHAQRRLTNLGLGAINLALLRLAFPVLLLGFAVMAHDRGWGLLNWLQLPATLALVLGFLLLDLALYSQHRLLHAIPILWRLHRVHHSDPEFDATTAVRFHPLEVLLSMLFKMAVVVATGAPVLAVLLFELALSLFALFSHGNVALPDRADRLLRRVIVTPDYHRVHHSVEAGETNSNYSFCLSIWDRLFASYRPRPAAGHGGMQIGQLQFRDRAALRLVPLLRQPMVPTE